MLIVTLEEAQALHRSDARSPVLRMVREAGASLYPMPAFSPGEPGERTFVIEADAMAEDRLCDRLRQLGGVEACYRKPQDAPP